MTQKERILNILRANGSATNIELNRICFRYGARIKDLRDDGWDIRTKHLKGSEWLFTLEQNKPMSADEANDFLKTLDTPTLSQESLI